MSGPAWDLVRIAGGPIEVEVLPAVGARLHRLRAFGRWNFVYLLLMLTLFAAEAVYLSDGL